MTRFQNLLRVGSLATVVALTAGTGLVYGQGFSSINGTTGPRSENISDITNNRIFDLAVVNDQQSLNDYFVDVNSGDNIVDYNTSVFGTDLSGNVDVNVATDRGILSNGAFDMFSMLDSFMPLNNVGSVIAATGNGITGPNSENENIINADQETNISLRNNSRVNNVVDFQANTGNNEITNNTTVGTVGSGDVVLNADLANSASRINNFPVIGVGALNTGFDTVDARFSNNVTGPNSENINRLEANSVFNAAIDNTSTVDNQIEAEVNTGNNEVFNNTTVGGFQSGDVRVDLVGTNY